MATLDKHADPQNWEMIGGKPADLDQPSPTAGKRIDDPHDMVGAPHPPHGDHLEADPSPADSAHNSHASYRALETPDAPVPTLE